MGVYKQWTGLLEWWNTGMVDWIIFHLFHVVYHIQDSEWCTHVMI